jgi:hypothetical protein
MKLLDVIVNAQGSPVQQMARNYGVNEQTVTDVIGQFIPALTNGMKRNIDAGGLDGLMAALNNGGHDRYLDEPGAMQQNEAVVDGNNILGHLLGDKSVSRELASRTSQQTGVSSDLLKQMLPGVAGLVMGAMKKRTQEQGMSGLSQSSPASAMGSLMSLLDADGDGSAIDDLLGLAARFLR